MTSDANVAGAPPKLESLQAVPVALWDRLLPHIRDALQAVPDDALTPMLRRLRSAPASRLRAGRVRRDLCRALSDGGGLWVALRTQLRGDGELAELWRDAMQAPTESTSSAEPEPPPGNGDARVDRAKERARALKAQRDDLARQLDGANARAAVAEQGRADAEAEAAELRATIKGLRAQLEASAQTRADEVDRERRRRDREFDDVRAELRDTRRALEEARRELEDARAAAAAAREATRDTDVSSTEPELVHGRPSRVPDDLVPGTTEHSRALLPRGRTVLVDGYNVTRTHRTELGLAEQREWLIGLASGAATRFGLSLTLVFDGHGGVGLSSTRTRGIRVEFSRDGMSADDDLVFLVAALPDDEPVTVVTNDVELKTRLEPYRVDTLGTQEFLWAVG